MNELKCKKSELIGLLIRIIPTGYPGLNRFMNQLSLKDSNNSLTHWFVTEIILHLSFILLS